VLFAGISQPSIATDVTDRNDKTESSPQNSGAAESKDANSGASEPPQAQASDKNGEGTPAPAPEPNPLDIVTAERDKLREQLLRTAADFDNFRKRSKRDVDEARQRGKDDLVRDLLPVFDNLERAVQTADTASDMRSVVDGVRMVLKLFEDTTERMGLTRVKSAGERFDPAVHEAIQQQETDAHPPGTIISEVVPGYRFGQRLVRPAMVIVARKPSEPKPEEGKGGDAQAAPAGASARPPAASKTKSEPAPAGGNGAQDPRADGAARKDPKETE
jgi:molecular chaperone GrpE